MSALIKNLRRGEGPFWGTMKGLAKRVLSFHLPATGVLRPFWRGMYALHVAIRELWVWSRRFFWNEPLFRSQCSSVGSRFRMEELPYINGAGRITIGADVTFSGKSSFAFNNRHIDQPNIEFGDGTFVGHQCHFRVGKSILIGRHCLFAGGVGIADYDGHPLDAAERRSGLTSHADEMRPVIIGDDVWLGANALVLKGVTIGDRSVIGAHAVVTKDVPSDTIVAGNPARVVKRLSIRAMAGLVGES